VTENKGNSGDSSGTREDKAVLLAEHAGASVYCADWRALLDVVPECDAVIVDAPYSERCHSGHRAATGLVMRRDLAYSAWGPADVAAFVSAWSPRCSGWFVTITDHVLLPAWEQELAGRGRYVFSPLAFVEPGSRVRLVGDGPSQWSTWIVVARPRSRGFLAWGALPGAYVLPGGHGPGERNREVVGGKPLWLMERLVEDYTRPGALVVDPCCGAGTTLVAAQRTGRRAIGGDAMREHAEIAAKRISKPAQAPLWVPGSNEVSHATQSQLFDEGEQGK
jgi:site-specific DNA-methyltransferase (adenine-specific)